VKEKKGHSMEVSEDIKKKTGEWVKSLASVKWNLGKQVLRDTGAEEGGSASGGDQGKKNSLWSGLTKARGRRTQSQIQGGASVPIKDKGMERLKHKL